MLALCCCDRIPDKQSKWGEIDLGSWFGGFCLQSLTQVLQAQNVQVLEAGRTEITPPEPTFTKPGGVIMACQIKMLATKPDKLSSIPSSNVVEELTISDLQTHTQTMAS